MDDSLDPAPGAPPPSSSAVRVRDDTPDGPPEAFRSVVREGVVAFGIKAAGAALGFAFTVLLGRLLGADGAGVYFLGATVVGIGAVVGRVGLDNAVLRFAAVCDKREDWDELAGLRSLSLRITATVSLAVAGIVVLVAPWISVFVFEEPALTTPLRVMALGIPATALLNVHAELLKAIRRLREAMLVQALGVPAVMVVVLAVLVTPLGVVGAAVAYAVASLVVLGFGWGFFEEAAPQLRGRKGRFDRGVLLAGSTPLFWVALMNLALGVTDTLMLGVFVDTGQVGVYGAALRTTAVCSMLLAVVNAVVGPRLSAFWVDRDVAAMRTLVRRSTWVMAAASLPLLALFALAPSWILGLFGGEFRSGADAMTVLAVGQFLALATGPVAFLLMMTGHEKVHRNNVVVSAVANVLLNLWLIPTLGILGAAVATSASLALKNVLAVICARRVLARAAAGNSE